MKRTFITNNGIEVNIHTVYEFAELVDASDYNEDAEGLCILWWNPKYKNGESQVDPEVFPYTVEGLMRASSEANKLNEHIWYENSYHA